MRLELKRGNDQIVTLPRLRLTGVIPYQYLNAATVKATLLDGFGIVQEPFHEVTLTYVPDSEGTYQWEIDGPQLMMPKGDTYRLEVTAVEAGMDFREVYAVTVID